MHSRVTTNTKDRIRAAQVSAAQFFHHIAGLNARRSAPRGLALVRTAHPP
jgi:hypothetical protein